jgi:hypothetical protein
MTCSEKLKSPKWQKKRLYVFNRDKWACTKCGNKELTLHVHHEKYHENPWDTPMEYLKTLCEECHEKMHESNDGTSELIRYLNHVIEKNKKERFDFESIIQRRRYFFGLFIDILFDSDSIVRLGKDMHFVVDHFLDSAGLSFVKTKK